MEHSRIITLAGDKSIAHRCIILSSLSSGKTRIENFPANKDCFYTIEAFKKLGIKITRNAFGAVTVFGKGLFGLKKPKRPIFLGDSGTTFRLLLGVLAGENFNVTLTAGKFLRPRPMLRVTAPLRRMGANIKAKVKRKKGKIEEYPPVTIKGGSLKAITYKMPVSSAQVKSAILLAALFAKGKTEVIEPIKTRDHTERLLRLFGADLAVWNNKIWIRGGNRLISPGRIYIPGDISSGSFFMVMAAILPNFQVTLKNVSLNPSRIGIIRVLKRMKANIQLSVAGTSLPLSVLRQSVMSLPKDCQLSEFEPMGNIIVKSSLLKGTVVKKEEIPSLIDELPILMVAACFACGETVFRGVEELRLKETDRIESMTQNLRKMGANIKVKRIGGRESIIIAGSGLLYGARVRSFGDHRTAMSMAVAALATRGKTSIDDLSCINKSFPDFLTILKTLTC